MNKLFFFTVLSVLSFSLHAQKVKVKNGEILVDDIPFGRFEKIKNTISGNTYLLKSLSDSVLVSVQEKRVNSIIEQKDLVFDYLLVSFPTKNNAKAAISSDEILAINSDTYFAKHFIDRKFITSDGLNHKVIDAFLLENKDTIPSYIVKQLETERKQLEEMDVIVERDRQKSIEVFSNKPDEVIEFGKRFSRKNYDIYQDKVLIGHASFYKSLEFGTFASRGDKLVIYNIKRIPIGRLGTHTFGDLKIYALGLKTSKNNLDLDTKTTPSPEQILISVAKFFISKNVL
jgi:hypothetical protein